MGQLEVGIGFVPQGAARHGLEQGREPVLGDPGYLVALLGDGIPAGLVAGRQLGMLVGSAHLLQLAQELDHRAESIFDLHLQHALEHAFYARAVR